LASAPEKIVEGGSRWRVSIEEYFVASTADTLFLFGRGDYERRDPKRLGE
jgi:hypothetical protein